MGLLRPPAGPRRRGRRLRHALPLLRELGRRRGDAFFSARRDVPRRRGNGPRGGHAPPGVPRRLGLRVLRRFGRPRRRRGRRQRRRRRGPDRGLHRRRGRSGHDGVHRLAGRRARDPRRHLRGDGRGLELVVDGQVPRHRAGRAGRRGRVASGGLRVPRAAVARRAAPVQRARGRERLLRPARRRPGPIVRVLWPPEHEVSGTRSRAAVRGRGPRVEADAPGPDAGAPRRVAGRGGLRALRHRGLPLPGAAARDAARARSVPPPLLEALPRRAPVRRPRAHAPPLLARGHLRVVLRPRGVGRAAARRTRVPLGVRVRRHLGDPVVDHRVGLVQRVFSAPAPRLPAGGGRVLRAPPRRAEGAAARPVLAAAPAAPLLLLQRRHRLLHQGVVAVRRRLPGPARVRRRLPRRARARGVGALRGRGHRRHGDGVHRRRPGDAGAGAADARAPPHVLEHRGGLQRLADLEGARARRVPLVRDVLRVPLRRAPRGTQIFNPTSMRAYATVSTQALWLGFENSTRAIDSSKHQPNRLRCDRARDV